VKTLKSTSTGKLNIQQSVDFRRSVLRRICGSSISIPHTCRLTAIALERGEYC